MRGCSVEFQRLARIDKPTGVEKDDIKMQRITGVHRARKPVGTEKDDIKMGQSPLGVC